MKVKIEQFKFQLRSHKVDYVMYYDEDMKGTKKIDRIQFGDFVLSNGEEYRLTKGQMKKLKLFPKG